MHTDHALEVYRVDSLVLETLPSIHVLNQYKVSFLLYYLSLSHNITHVLSNTEEFDRVPTTSLSTLYTQNISLYMIAPTYSKAMTKILQYSF